MTPEINTMNAELAEVFGGWKRPEHPDTKAKRAERKLTHSAYDSHWLSPTGLDSRVPSYYTSLPLAMELLRATCKARRWSYSLSSTTEGISLEIWEMGNPNSDVANAFYKTSEEEAISVALASAAKSLGLIKP